MRRILLQQKFIRLTGRQAYRATARLSIFGAPPKVFANSMPKSGTHLLSGLLVQMPDMRSSGRHINLNDIGGVTGDGWAEVFDGSKLRSEVERVRNGQFLTGHVPWIAEVQEVLDQAGVRAIVILRDPRDIVVSQAFYILSRRDHFRHARFMETHPDIESAITACILGLPTDPVLGGGLPDIGARMRAYLGWLKTPGVLAVRFEDLVGSKGGGDDSRQMNVIGEICRHVQRPDDEKSCRRLAELIWSSKSATFRSGKIGNWKQHLASSHIEAFKRIAGEPLVAMGYEKGLNW